MVDLFHISLKKLNDDDLFFVPRVPKTAGNGENNSIPRICISDTLRGCINSILSSHIHNELMRCRARNETNLDLYVYEVNSEIQSNEIIRTEELIESGHVLDATRTGEMWILSPIKMKLHSVLEVTNVEESFQWLDFADFSFEGFPFQIEFKVKREQLN